MVKQYPHLMERYPDYHSASVLGKIYDEVKSQESEADPSISKWLISLISLFPLTTEMVTNFLLFFYVVLFFIIIRDSAPAMLHRGSSIWRLQAPLDISLSGVLEGEL